MAVSMDDDVPLILTLDDSGSSASAPLEELDQEELPNESKSPLSVPARCWSLCPGETPGLWLGVRGLPGDSRSGAAACCSQPRVTPRGPDRSFQRSC